MMFLWILNDLIYEMGSEITPFVYQLINFTSSTQRYLKDSKFNEGIVDIAQWSGVHTVLT